MENFLEKTFEKETAEDSHSPFLKVYIEVNQTYLLQIKKEIKATYLSSSSAASILGLSEEFFNKDVIR